MREPIERVQNGVPKNVTFVPIRGRAASVSRGEFGSWMKRPRLVAIALTLFLFAPVFVMGRVRYDDHWLWADDSPLRDPTWSTLHDIFFEFDARARHPYGTEYLPVRDLAVAADMAIWGDNESGPHAVQLGLFILTVVGLGSLLVRFGWKPELAWLSTMLWAAHPIHVESIAWLSERKGVLAGLLFVACGHAWVRFRTGRSWLWGAFAALAAVAAVWSKAPAMFGVVVLASWDLLLLPARRRRWIAIGAVATATAVAAIPVVLVALDGRIITGSTAHDLSRLDAPLGAQGHYIESLFLVRPPAISYEVLTNGPGVLEIVLGAGAVVASVLIAVRWRNDHAKRQWLAVLAWAWIWFVPISHVVMPVHIFVADRFAYLWSFAGCAFVAGLIRRLRPPWASVAAAIVVCVVGIATIRAQNSWTNSVELFSRAFETNPGDPRACENLAMALADEGSPDDALAVLDRGLRKRPGHPHLLTRKSRVLEGLQQHDAALESSRMAARSQFATAMWNHARLLRTAGRANEALAWAALAARRHPNIDEYIETYVELLAETGQSAYARGYVSALLVRDPNSKLGHRLLAGLHSNR